MMKLLLWLIALTAALLAGCDNAARIDTRTIGNLVDHLQRTGLNIGETSPVMAEIVGAAEGSRIQVYGKGIEVYRYDVSNESQKLTLEKVKKENTLTAMNIVMPVTVNGAFVLATYHEHPEKERILKAFNSWGSSDATANPQSAGGNASADLLSAFNGVWSIAGETGLFKFNLSGAKKIVSIVDDREITNIQVRVAGLDDRNRTAHIVFDADPSKTLITLKQNFTSGSSTKFNLLFTTGNGQRGELNFVRNIDLSDDLKIPEPDRGQASAPATPLPANSSAEAAKVPVVGVQPAPVPQEAKPPVESAAFAPSFDCAKVSTGAERLICSSRELSELDVSLGQAYRQAMNSAPNKDTLKIEQVAWRKNERDACADTPCMLNVYRKRITQLTAR